MPAITDRGTPWFWVATGSAILAALLSILHIGKHLMVYNEPVLQRHTCRIIFMVVVGSVTSLLAMLFNHHAIYMLTIRDCYDSFVIYNFVALCIALAGGPGAIVSQSENVVVRHCCLPPQQVDGNFLRRCKQGTLQFVILKPVFAGVSLLLFSLGKLDVGNWSPTNGYVYMAIALNATYSVALFSLLQFYLGTRELLSAHRPGVKFLLIKAVIFVTFWQSIALAVLLRTQVINGHEDAEYIQNMLVCMEMGGASLLMLVAFPWSEYKTSLSKSASGHGVAVSTGALAFRPALAHFLTVNDVAQDVVHTFSHEYSEYILHNNALDPILAKQRKEEQQALGAHSPTAMHSPFSLDSSMEMGLGRSNVGLELAHKPPKARPKKGRAATEGDRAGLLSAGGADSDDGASNPFADTRLASNPFAASAGGAVMPPVAGPSGRGGAGSAGGSFARVSDGSRGGAGGPETGTRQQQHRTPQPQQPSHQQVLYTLGSDDLDAGSPARAPGASGGGGGSRKSHPSWDDDWLSEDGPKPAGRRGGSAAPLLPLDFGGGDSATGAVLPVSTLGSVGSGTAARPPAERGSVGGSSPRVRLL